MPIRVLVVDDSAFMRRIIREAIAAETDMEVVGHAINGVDALAKIELLQPDVVTMDVEMPEMDGLTALRRIMATAPRPVVMLSSVTLAGAVTTVRALTIGAVDFVAKPSGAISLDFESVRQDLIGKIRVAAGARVSVGRPRSTESPLAPPAAHALPKADGRAFERLVIIGCSTGGPKALSAVVPGLAPDGKTAYLIVQHMPAGFTHSLAQRLDGLGPLNVREAREGELLQVDTALVAPGDFHLRLSHSGMVQLSQDARVHGVRPSIDVALSSISHSFGPRTVTAILTGMGSDGAAGAEAMRAAGGYVLAEDESTAVVWGMPRAVVERGGADRVVPLDGVAPAIADALRVRSTSSG